MVEVLESRPESPNYGDIWWQDIDEILDTWDSVDGDSPDEAMSWKRHDAHYPDVVRSIKELGFVRPLTCYDGKYDEPYTMGDGHHRLAAAIDLGLTKVLIQYSGDGLKISDDSGSWEYGNDIPEPEYDRQESW